MRVLLDTPLRFVDTDKFQHFNGSFFCLFPFAAGVEFNGFPQLVANGENRIQRCHWILKNNGAAFPAEFPHLSFRPCCQILTFIQDMSSGDFTGICKDLHDGVCRDRFP